ncbi:JAB domain-containing protein [Ekhidna sp.]|uniref:JAB domain-containing protein n=1 Tax=Ekhidna sp. TaxID=2608089 RepID=UPI0032ED97C3
MESKVSEIEIMYRNKVKAKDRTRITSSSDAHDLIREYWNEESIELNESFKYLLLNRANDALGIVNHSKGGIAGTVVDVRLIFAAAIKANATGLILAHNHPSGNLKPSYQDIQLTKRVKEAGMLLDIQLLDHLILSSESYLSMADQGLV